MSGNMVVALTDSGSSFGSVLLGASASVGSGYATTTSAALMVRQSGFVAIDPFRNSTYLGGQNFTSGVQEVVTTVFDNTNSNFYTNGGTAAQTASTGAFSVAAGQIFGGPNGTVSEALLFYSNLSAADQAILEKSQGFNYGIQIGGATISYNGLVTKWYDQSGNGYDVSQATTTRQPIIVSGGQLIQVGNRPAVLADGTTAQTLQAASYGFGTSAFSMVSVVLSLIHI